MSYCHIICFTCSDEGDDVESRGGVTMVLEEDWDSVGDTSKPERRKISFFQPFPCLTWIYTVLNMYSSSEPGLSGSTLFPTLACTKYMEITGVQ